MTSAQARELQETGHLTLRQVIDPAWLEDLRAAVARLMEIEGENAGAEFRKEPNAQRLANLVDKGEVFQRVVAHPEVLEGARAVLGPDFKLGSLNYRAAEARSNSAQPLHCDMGAIPDSTGNCVFNSIWLLDEFTAENGATRFVPESHRWGKLPQESLPDPSAPHPAEQLVLAQAGDVILMNAHLWHGGTANRSDSP